MREGWREVPISDVVTRSDERLGTKPEPLILTCTEGAGLIPQTEKFKKRIAADDTSDYKVVRFGDVVYNPYLLWKGAIAQSQYAQPGITSPVYEILRPRAGVEARFLGLALCHHAAIRQYDAISIGSIERRRRAVLPQVMRVTIPLPPLADQRRIVDLVESLDGLRLRAAAVAALAALARAASLEAALADPTWPIVQLRDIAVPGGLIGGPFGSDLRTRDYAAAGVPVINGSNHSPTGLTLAGPFQYVSAEKAEQLSRNIARPSDVVATNQGTVGQVSLVPSAPFSKYVVSQRQLRLRLDAHRALPEYVVLALRARDAQSQVITRTISTAVTHINLGIFGDLQIPLPALDDQRRVVAEQTAYIDLANASDNLSRRASSARGALLARLLSGVHEIPPSYDRFLDGAA